MRIAALSDIGLARVRNEDVFYFDPVRGIVVIADGLGGAKAGEIAAAMAVNIVSSRLCSAVDQGLVDVALADEMHLTLQRASEEIYQSASQREEWQGMACSLIAAVLESNSCLIGHAGDTRAYLFVDDSLHQMTVDDTPVGALVKRGYLLPERARVHHLKNFLTKSLGSKAVVEANIIHFPIRPNERLLFCSDGLWSMLEDDQIQEILAEENNPETACSKLVAAANEKGGQDNVTAVVVNIDKAISEESTEEMPVPGT